MNRLERGFVGCLLAAATVGCAGSGEQRWETTELRDHRLVGEIWDVQAGRFVDRSQLLAQAGQADYVLLGEVHINPDHHRLQVEVVRSLSDAEDPALVFEMFDRTDQPSIDAARAERPGDPDYIAEVTRFEERGWQWSYYRPLVEVGMERNLALLGGNAPSERVREVAHRGLSVLDEDELNRLGLAGPLPERAHADLVARIVEGHCGHLSTEMAERLVPAQRIKDASMADIMRGVDTRPVILIAGSGHVRDDYGVPYYLRLREPRASVVALGFVEVSEGYLEPSDYLASSVGQAAAFDFLWFTPRAETGDPCEKFKEGLKRLKERTAPEGQGVKDEG